MSGIDQLLSLAASQGANELRLAVEQEPQMFANGIRKRLTMAVTSEFALRHLVAELLTPERESQLREHCRLAMDHELPKVGRFRATFSDEGPGTLRILFLLLVTAGSAGAPEQPRRAAPTQVNPAPQPPTEDVPEAARFSSTAMAESSSSAIVTTPAVGTNSGTVANDQDAICPTEAFTELVRQAYQRRASDIHLTDMEAPCLRVDGRLLRLATDADQSISAYFSLTPELRRRLDAGSSADFGIDIPQAGRLRVSLFRSEGGLAAAVRLLPGEAPELAELNLPVPIADLVELSHGLVLVCGATGSGKSTTLAALAKEAMRRRSILLTTLEDPIEYSLTAPSHSIVRRRQVGRDVTSFRSGLRDALRADPDVILVGELRDADTIQLALTAAETGHLVLASMHSGGAASAIERIVDAYPSDTRTQIRVQLADALRAVLAQRLLPRADGNGRVPVLELLRVTSAVGNVIREGRTSQLATILQAGKREGMLSLDRCLADYVQSGLISLKQAQAEANEPGSLLIGR